MPLPLGDISQAHRSDPERTEQALTKVGLKGLTISQFCPFMLAAFYASYARLPKIIVFTFSKALNIVFLTPTRRLLVCLVSSLLEPALVGSANRLAHQL